MTAKTPPAVLPAVAGLASLVYFVQGALSLAAVAFPLLLRGEGWQVSEITTFSFFVGLPWTLKILYGALSDGFSLGGLHRKPYVILASFLSMASWLGLAFFPFERAFLYGFAFAANLGFAVTDVVTDAFIVEHSDESNTQVYQSFAWGARALGAVLGGITGGWLAQTISYRWIFLLVALLPLGTAVMGFFLREPPEKRGGREGVSLWVPIKGGILALFGGDLKWFALTMLALSFSASLGTPLFFFLKEKLQFSETFLGSLSSLTWLGAIVGCFLYGRFLRGVPLKKMLYAALILNALNILAVFLITNVWRAALISLAGGVVGYLGFLPLMAVAALLSRQKGMEGCLFALLMSVHNLGQLVSTWAGGRLFDIMGLQGLIFFSAGVGLIGFVFVNRLKTLSGEGPAGRFRHPATNGADSSQ